ncbi:hypothetical protein EJ04DRAFT_258603 [Polyplosphaeria fusca]|uniref:PQ-loop repeat-containing protein 2 n=1 Tax=Polyplosphaeria fusca TaxID=682080 RepID=A0A9P4QZT0_9PLEO|nr:hypothetical protein EJ04DRAFT_258603 [Polyplosphaeria fusca]
MPPYLSPLHLVEPSLPAHCEPANDFLYWFSATFHSCVPTNLAFISTVLGTCSIISWLFAQLPQIYKNWRLKSTSGLSIFFLAEWLLGDLSNVLGSLFTDQALWQVIIAFYYVSVDCALCGQWIWYELLKHGRPLRPAWSPVPSSEDLAGGRGQGGMQEVLDGESVSSTGSKPSSPTKPNGDRKSLPPDSPGRNIPHRSNPMDAFRIPNFARSPSAKESSSLLNTPPTGTPTNRTITRLASSSSPMPSPKTLLYTSLLLALLSHTTTATPLSPFAPPPLLSPLTTTTSSPSSPSATAGKILSWLSTLLYLLSRLPQLYKNAIRRSTAGLSPTLFAAAFFGNLFYSSSLLTNPCAWSSFAAGEGRGWVGAAGSERKDWVLRALPFFLGAAGVLGMDAGVGVQFWYFGSGGEEGRGRREVRDEVVVLVDGDGERRGKRWRWRRVSGWMRGWVPSVSVAGTPSGSVAGTPSGSRASTPAQGGSPSGGSSRIGIGGRWGSSRDALDEARALLGTSPRGSYGYGTP